jgi:hypothetical protein
MAFQERTAMSVNENAASQPKERAELGKTEKWSIKAVALSVGSSLDRVLSAFHAKRSRQKLRTSLPPTHISPMSTPPDARNN